MELETYLRQFIEGYLLEDLKSMAVIEKKLHFNQNFLLRSGV